MAWTSKCHAVFVFSPHTTTSCALTHPADHSAWAFAPHWSTQRMPFCSFPHLYHSLFSIIVVWCNSSLSYRPSEPTAMVFTSSTNKAFSYNSPTATLYPSLPPQHHSFFSPHRSSSCGSQQWGSWSPRCTSLYPASSSVNFIMTIVPQFPATSRPLPIESAHAATQVRLGMNPECTPLITISTYISSVETHSSTVDLPAPFHHHQNTATPPIELVAHSWRSCVTACCRCSSRAG